MDGSSVSSSADRLGVSKRRVHELISSGDLSAWRVGSQWVVPELALREAEAFRRGRGRPFTAAFAMGVCAAVSGDEAPWLTRVQRSRARRLLGEKRLDELADQLRARSKRHLMRAGTRSIQRLLQDERAVAGGVSAARAAQADVAVEDMHEVYVSDRDLDDLAHLYALRSDLTSPNLVVHVIPQLVSEAIRERGGLPVAAVALDLLDMGRLLGSERLQRAARDAIRRIESPA